MKATVIPITNENDKNTTSTYNEEVESSESGEMNLENMKQKMKKMIDFDGDGKIEMNDMYNNCKMCYHTFSSLYDVSLDNLPAGSAIGFLLTLFATFFITTGFYGTKAVMSEYIDMNYISKLE